MTGAHGPTGIDLYWIPLGAGGSGFVRLNGRLYEGMKCRLEGRRPLELLHTALRVHVSEGRFVVETMWPSPDRDGDSRGVAMTGPVMSTGLARVRVFRYEVRRWRNGVLPDEEEAIGGPQRVSEDPQTSRRLLDLVDSVPSLVWGRDELGTGDMWNSNSVISWLLTRSRVPMEAVRPPAGARAPGWHAGIAIAARPAPAIAR